MLYQNNITALSKKNPRLAQIIENTAVTGRYKTMPSQRKDKLVTLVDMKLNKNFYNGIDPYRVAENEIKNRKLRVPNVAVFLGFGLGYEVFEYLNQYPNALILVVEKDPEVLKTAFNAINYVELINKSNVYFAGCENIRLSYPIMFDFFNNPSAIYYLKSINILDQPVSFGPNKDYYIETIRIVKEAIQQVLLLYGNDPYDSLLGIKYTLRNISTIIDNPGIIDLKDVFKGKPGIVVASGPSLDKNIHLLEGLREKAVICAADGSVKILKSKGLPPAHLVTSLERVISISYLFEGLTEEDTKDSYLAACPVIVPETYANFPGKKIIVYRNFATFKWLDIKKGIIDIGPSSGNMAFKVLEYLGCDPIILIGQDLALGDDDKSHASGFHYGEKSFDENKIKQTGIEVEGNYKEKVKTLQVLKQFLLHYERDVASYKGTAINATEGGAKIHGTQIMTFQEAIDKYIKDNINTTQTIKDNLKDLKDKQKYEQINETLKKLYHAKDYSLKLIDVCISALKKGEIVEEILRRTDLNPNEEEKKTYKENMASMQKSLETFSSQDFYLILMHYVQSIFIKIMQDINAIQHKEEDSIERDVKLFLKYKELYSVLIGLIKKILEEFEVSIKLLEDFKEEFKKRLNK